MISKINSKSADKDKDILNVDMSYCISLKSHEDKWDSLISNIHKNGFPSCEIFEGIIGSSYEHKDVSNMLSVWQEYILKVEKTRHNHEHFNSWGGVGCYLSHIAIWKDAIAKGYKKIAVFEDDVFFTTGFKELVKEYVKLVPDDYHMLLFDSIKIITSPLDNKGLTNVKNTTVSKIDRFFGMHAYVITVDCIIILLSRAFPLEVQIDSYISFMSQLHSLKIYDIAGLCGQLFHVSSIQSICPDCPTLTSNTDITHKKKITIAMNILKTMILNKYNIILSIILVILIAILLCKNIKK